MPAEQNSAAEAKTKLHFLTLNDAMVRFAAMHPSHVEASKWKEINQLLAEHHTAMRDDKRSIAERLEAACSILKAEQPPVILPVPSMRGVDPEPMNEDALEISTMRAEAQLFLDAHDSARHVIRAALDAPVERRDVIDALKTSWN
jgi:hypothetical protein